MGNAGMITLIGAVVGIGLLGVLFYVSSLAKNVYAIKVQMKDDLSYEIDKMKNFVEKEMAQRQKWMMRELEGMVGDGGSADSAEIQALRTELKQEITDLREKFRKLAALQQAMAAKSTAAQPQSNSPSKELAFKPATPPKKIAG